MNTTLDLLHGKLSCPGHSEKYSAVFKLPNKLFLRKLPRKFDEIVTAVLLIYCSRELGRSQQEEKNRLNKLIIYLTLIEKLGELAVLTQ